MSNFAIEVENLSKRYQIGRAQSRNDTLRDAIADGFKRFDPRRWLQSVNHHPETDQEYIWALKEVSFQVKYGEVVGIIGRNGAGKSTLLKVLSRITEPTSGRAVVRGRVGSLLEVGTGFHPELTGRENIYLNGTILGMKRAEIERKFDEIVAFSEIEKFLDTPVKRYSSGMYVRLAFAVAAHLEPEILLVDEVLAVGDASFQKKCLGKMGEVAQAGRTVLFVSHNMGAISRLCERTLLLNAGTLYADGISIDVISKYLQSGSKGGQTFKQMVDESIPLCLLEGEVFSENPDAFDTFPRHKPITVHVIYKVNRKIDSVHLYANIITIDGNIVFGTGDADTKPDRFRTRKPGLYECFFTIPANILNEGSYMINISLGIPYQKIFQYNNNILSFTIVDIEPSKRVIHRKRAGLIWIDLPWDYIGDEPFG